MYKEYLFDLVDMGQDKVGMDHKDYKDLVDMDHKDLVDMDHMGLEDKDMVDNILVHMDCKDMGLDYNY